MLYIYKEKIYVKPFDNKIVEVSISKKNNEYNVKAEKAPMELNEKQLKELVSITIKDAFEHQNKGNVRNSFDKE